MHCARYRGQNSRASYIYDCGINTVRWETDCPASFREHAIHEWSKDVTRINAKCGQGLNKLRTYE